MGIPFLYRWLRDKGYRGVLRRNVPKNVSSFSLDANGIIHNCAQIVYAYGQGEDPQRRKLIQTLDPKILEAEFHKAVAIKLQTIMAQVQPKEILVIAIDGVAPQGKITQQRQRRFRSAMDRSDTTLFDSNAITPGTDFMIRLDNFIQRWIVAYRDSLPPKVIYSSHMVPGEGEHKIVDLMRSGEISGDGAHVLYGMDADLIMLSMIAPLNNISLMREDINDVIDINSLKTAIQEELKLPTAIHDFVVMMFTIGNDFLPHMPSLESLSEATEILTATYLKTGVSLVTDSDLDWVGLSKFLTNLALEEPKLLHAEAIRDVKYPSRMLKAASKRQEKMQQSGVMKIGQDITFETAFDYNVFRGAWYQNALVPKGANASLIQQLVPGHNFGVTMEKVIDMSTQYLIDMAWVYNYYTKDAVAINTDFVYSYHHTPVLRDLAAVSNQLQSVTGYLATPNQLVLNPIHQLLSVLPLKSRDLLPKEVKHLMSKDSPISDLYPETVMIERDGKNTEWQGTVLINFVDPSRVINAVNETTIFSTERIKLYSQGQNIVLIQDPEIRQLNKDKQEFRDILNKSRGYKGKGKSDGRGQNKSRDYQNKSRDYQSGGRGQYKSGGRGQNKYQGKSGDRNKSRDYQNRNKSSGRGRNNSNYRSNSRNKPNYNKPEVNVTEVNTTEVNVTKQLPSKNLPPIGLTPYKAPSKINPVKFQLSPTRKTTTKPNKTKTQLKSLKSAPWKNKNTIL